MWPLIVRFFTKEAYAVRLIRLLMVAVGMMVAEGFAPIWLPEWAGYIFAAIGAMMTGTNDTPSGIPKDN